MSDVSGQPEKPVAETELSCYCDEQGIGEPSVTCGDCPRDYGQKVAESVTDEQRDAAIDAALAERGYPANPRNAARAGWYAALQSVAEGRLLPEAEVRAAMKKQAVLHEQMRERLSAAVQTLHKLGYTYQGGELWKPPLGKKPDFDLAKRLEDWGSEIYELQAGEIPAAKADMRAAAAILAAPQPAEPVAELEALRAERDALLVALKPFADADLTLPTVRDTFGFDVLRARAAIDAARTGGGSNV